jgi:hypothetical protein
MLSCTFSHLSPSFDSVAIASRTNEVCWDGLDLALALSVMVITPQIPPIKCGFTGAHGSPNDFSSHELEQPHYGDFMVESKGSDLEPHPPKDHSSLIPPVISLGYRRRTRQRETVTASPEALLPWREEEELGEKFVSEFHFFCFCRASSLVH